MVNSVNNQVSEVEMEEQGSQYLSMQFLLKTLLLRWQWILLSTVICLSVAFLYLRYTSVVYEVKAKVLIKEDDARSRSRVQNQIQSAANLGLMTNSEGFDNEVEILKSVSIADRTVRDLKMYVTYQQQGMVKDRPIYKINPVEVDMDQAHLDTLAFPVKLVIDRDGGNYSVKGEYKTAPNSKKVEFSRSGKLPLTIATPVGVLTVKRNLQAEPGWKDGRYCVATVYNPNDMAQAIAGGTSVDPLSKTTTIATVALSEVLPERGVDYLTHLTEVYNLQANIDKNQIATRTEKFINERLEKINAELSHTDGAIENYKRNNNVVDIKVNAQRSVGNTDEYEKKLQELDTQILLLKNIEDFMNQPENKYQTLPMNVGLKDQAAIALIAQFNSISLERSNLLSSASEMSPAVKKNTALLDGLYESLRSALRQSVKNVQLERKTVAQTQSRYSGELSETPQQERILTEIGREQTVKSSLYIMLLEKREENSISLAATADKGKLIDAPEFKKVRPKKPMIMLIGLLLGIAIPFVIFILLEMLRFRIEGHDDVASLTKMPIIADIPVANESAKTKGEIVVQENRNNQMEEIFRSMRTNLQFMLKEDENVIMFTSSVSGEGKTFIAANLAVSFALLGKKTILIGLDIRRPRLAELFERQELKNNGISLLLSKNNVTLDDIKQQTFASGVCANLDLLPAGPIPPNPAELVSRKSMDDIFEILKKEYDYVIVDTAPVGLVTDTLQIGRVANVCVVVTRADFTEKSAFNMFNDMNTEKKLPNMCVAINGIDFSKNKYGYAYGYGSYGKYGKYGRYGKYGKSYGAYGSYGNYASSHYGNTHDDSIKTK